MNDFELHAFIDDDGTTKPFYLRISQPSKVADAEDYVCRVHAPDLFKNDKEIFGVDKAQAETLAFDFVRSVLGTKRLLNEKGEVIKL